MTEERTMATCSGCEQRYNSKGGKYHKCYSCQQEQRQLDLMSGQLYRCLFCHTPHSAAFSCCYTCRQTRLEAAEALQREIVERDGYECRECGTSLADGATLRVQSLKPDRRSTAPWRFATFCLQCASMKPPDDLAATLVREYTTVMYSYLNEFEQQNIEREAEDLGIPKPGLAAFLYGLAGHCARCNLPCHRYEAGGRPVCNPCRGLSESGFERLFRGGPPPVPPSDKFEWKAGDIEWQDPEQDACLAELRADHTAAQERRRALGGTPGPGPAVTRF